jgi:hypothetical protein
MVRTFLPPSSRGGAILALADGAMRRLPRGAFPAKEAVQEI